MRATTITLLLAVPALAGCAALTSTTNTVARTLETGLNATTQASQATTGTGESAEYADAREFVSSQFVMVRREAATGGGEHIAALARLMDESDADAFGVWMQANCDALFTDLDAHADLVTRIVARRGETMSLGRKNDA